MDFLIVVQQLQTWFSEGSCKISSRNTGNKLEPTVTGRANCHSQCEGTTAGALNETKPFLLL